MHHHIAPLATVAIVACLTSNARAQAGTLVISTSPPGVQVFVNGKLVGKTPLRAPVPAGEHVVLLRKQGQEDVFKVRSVKSGARVLVDHTFKAAKAGPKRRIRAYFGVAQKPITGRCTDNDLDAVGDFVRWELNRCWSLRRKADLAGGWIEFEWNIAVDGTSSLRRTRGLDGGDLVRCLVSRIEKAPRPPAPCKAKVYVSLQDGGSSHGCTKWVGFEGAHTRCRNPPDLARLEGRADITGLYLSDPTAAQVAVVKGLPGLTVLQLFRPRGAWMVHLTPLTNLGFLTVHDANISNADIARLSHLRKLRRLVLARTNITNNGLAHLASLPQLSYLGLRGTRVTDVSPLVGMKSLERLNLRDTRLTKAGVRSLARLKNLTHLFLVATPMSDAWLKRLTGLAKIEYLDLSRTAVTAAGLATVARFTKLRVLRLDRLDIGKGFSKLKKLPELTSLVVGHKRFKARALGAMAGTGLEELRITFGEVDGSTLSATTFPKLESLTLGRVSLALNALARLPTIKKLRRVSISAKSMTDAHLAGIGGLKALVILKLEGTSVRGEGLAHLRGLPNLKSLQLRGSPVQTGAVEVILGISSLRSLDIRDTQINSRGIETLRKRRPDLEVISD